MEVWFKNIKSIVEINVMIVSLNELAGVGATGIWLLRQCEPEVSHPRWSQALNGDYHLRCLIRPGADANVQRYGDRWTFAEWILPLLLATTLPRFCLVLQLAGILQSGAGIFGLPGAVSFARERNAAVRSSILPKHLMHVTGEWVMRFLVLVLLAALSCIWLARLARYRRMLGLYVWFYATLHLLVFAGLYRVVR